MPRFETDSLRSIQGESRFRDWVIFFGVYKAIRSMEAQADITMGVQGFCFCDILFLKWCRMLVIYLLLEFSLSGRSSKEFVIWLWLRLVGRWSKGLEVLPFFFMIGFWMYRPLSFGLPFLRLVRLCNFTVDLRLASGFCG